jgi:hypothetical protein
MSTPVRGADGPLGYAPRWARSGSGRADTAVEGKGRSAVPELPRDLRSPRVAMPARETVPLREAVVSREAVPQREFAPRRDLLSSPEIARQEAVLELDDEPFREPASQWDAKPSRVSRSGSFWKRKKRSAAFEGDTALRELRSHLASAPDRPPEPPLYPAKTPIFAAVVRLTGIMVLAAAGALGFLWITAPHGAPPQVASRLGGNEVALASYPPVPPVTYRGLEAPRNSARASEDVAAVRTPNAPSAAPWAAANYPHDAADGTGAPSAALTPRVPVAPRAPSRVAAPPPAAEPATPPTPAESSTAAPPPAAPAPLAKATVPAITAPVSVAPPATPSVATRDRDEVDAMLGRARSYLAAGDVAAARLLLRRAAERDDPQAALALGGTYDPIVLKRLGILNFQGDTVQAREWYRRAAELGSPDAASRLELLAQIDH